MRLAFVVVMLVGCAHDPRYESNPAPAPAPAPAPSPGAAKKVALPPLAQSLAGVDLFAIGGVGFAGEQSEGERLTLELAKEPNAVATFEKLAGHPNRVARLYAYWALKTLDAARAASYQAGLLGDITRVQAAHGCIIGEQPAHELAAEIDKYPLIAMPQP